MPRYFEDPDEWDVFNGGTSGGYGGGASWDEENDPYGDYLFNPPRRAPLVGMDVEPQADPLARYRQFMGPQMSEPPMARTPDRTTMPPVDMRPMPSRGQQIPGEEPVLLPSHSMANRPTPPRPLTGRPSGADWETRFNPNWNSRQQAPRDSIDPGFTRPAPANAPTDKGFIRPRDPNAPTDRGFFRENPSFAQPGQRTIGQSPFGPIPPVRETISRPSGQQFYGQPELNKEYFQGPGAQFNPRQMPQRTRGPISQRPVTTRPASQGASISIPQQATGIDPRSIASVNTPMGVPNDYFSGNRNIFQPRQGSPLAQVPTSAFSGMARGVDTATPRDVMPQQNSGPQAPQYDYGPLNQYQRYLASEPQREDYKPNKLGSIINIAAAGLEGYRTGSPGAAIKLGETLNDRPYQQAQAKWLGKGKMYESAANLAETRYRNENTAYDRQVDNARQQQQVEISRRNADLAERKFQKELSDADRDLLTKGWNITEGADGNMQIWRVNPLTGQPEIKPTSLPNKDWTAAQKTDNAELLERGRESRAAAGRAVTREGFNRADTRQEKDIAVRRSEGEEGRKSREWMNATELAARGATGSKNSSLLSSQGTAAGLVKNRYPELDDEGFRDAFTVTGNRIKINPKFTPDVAGDTELANYARKKFPSDIAKQRTFLEKFKAMRGEASLFVPDDDDEDY